jgi:hypothetical protein
MRRILLIGGLVVLLLAPVSRSQSPSTQGDLQKENRDLRADNERLRKRLDDLNKRFEKELRGPATLPFNFRFHVAPPTTRPNPFEMPRAPSPKLFVPGEGNVPKDWIKKEFNGEAFYIIPCN